MWIQHPGIVNERMVLLGTPQTNIYLLKGDVYMLVGGGAPWMVPELMAQINSWGIDMQQVRYLFVGHSHYDHVGAVPFLQKRYPHLEVLASRQAARYFDMPKAVKNARKFSMETLRRRGIPDTVEGISLDFDVIRPARVLGDDDRIEIGDGLVFRTIEAPGHSRCSMALYAEEQKWLFPSDAMSIPINNGREFACTASESFSDFIRSLRRLESFDVRLCAWEHYGLMTGEHAHRIVERVLNATLAYKETLKNQVGKIGDMDAAADWAARRWLDQTTFDFIPFDVMLYICRQMVRNAVAEDVADLH